MGIGGSGGCLAEPKIQRQQGVLVLLDALRAKSFADAELRTFLESRKRLRRLLNIYQDEFLLMDAGDLTVATFNDTFVVALGTGKTAPSLGCLDGVAALISLFVVASLANGVLLRGAISMGTMYMDEIQNVVMGDAVNDAADWHERGEWVGVHCTPHTFIEIDRMRGKRAAVTESLLDYKVPVRGGAALPTVAVNWPQSLRSQSRDWIGRARPRDWLLRMLSRGPIPYGTEAKYYNTIAFFDYCWQNGQKRIQPD